MKKLLCLIILVSSVSFSQKLLIGPQLGMNLIQLDNYDYGKNFHPGWYGGAAFDYQITNWLGIQTGVYYSQKRQAYSDADTTPFTFYNLIDSSFAIDGLDMNTYTTINGRTSQHYFDIPLMASFNYKGLTASIGGFVGFMFNARKREEKISQTPFIQAIDIGTIIGSASGSNSSSGGFDAGSLIASFFPKGYTDTFTESTNSDNLRKFDYGLKFNIGYQPNQFGVYVGYQLGLNDYRIKIPDGAKKQTHQFIQFSMRYMFGLDQPYKQSFGKSQL